MGSERGAPYRIDASVNPMQAPRCHPGSHCSFTQPQLEELSERHHPVLPVGEFRDQHVKRVRT